MSKKVKEKSVIFYGSVAVARNSRSRIVIVETVVTLSAFVVGDAGALYSILSHLERSYPALGVRQILRIF